jgi:hypothetical protein
MLIRQLLENKKGIKAVKYNKKPKAHTPADERKVIGPNVPKKKEKVTERVGQNADGSLILPDPNINRLAGKPNPPAAEPAPSNVKSGGATVEYSGKTYDVMVFGDKSIRPRISGSDTVVSAKVYTKGNKMFVLLDASAQEGVEEGSGDPEITPGMKTQYGTVMSVKGNTVTVKASNGELTTVNIHDIQQGVAEDDVEEFLHKVARSGDKGYDMLYNAQKGKYGREIEQAIQDMYDDISIDTGYHGDDDFEQIYDRMLDNIETDYGQKGVEEGAMPALVIRIKEKIRLMSDDEKKEYFKGKTRKQLQQMARRHGYGENSDVYAKYATQGVDEGGRNYDDNRTGFGRPERDMSDESNLLYIYKDGRVKQRMVSNTVEREARDQGFRDTPEQALKMHGIVKSKFKPGKWIQKQGDQWVDVYPFGKPNDIAETATPGATSAGNVATLGMNPKLSPGPARGKKSYIGTPGKSGTKAPPQPKVNQPKTKHGTAVNALDMKSNIFGGGKAIKRK